MVNIMLTVNPGIEDLAAEEARVELGGEPSYRVLSGRVFLRNVAEKRLGERVSRLKMANRAVALLTTVDIRPEATYLPQLRRLLGRKLMGVVDYITPETPFAVKAERIGEHEYSSMDIAALLGDVVNEIEISYYGRRPSVNLRNPSVIVYALADNDKLYIGIMLTGPWSMHRRGYRIYDHPAALKPTLAQAMLYLSGTRDKQAIGDPMCGGGTIPIEAALTHEDALIWCSDYNEKHVRGAELNAMAAGIRSRIKFKVLDARKLDTIGIEFDHLVLNPPYGIRYGDPWSIRRLYKEFLYSASRSIAPDGRITLITTEFHFIHKVIGSYGLEVIHERTVYHGNLYPHIIVLAKVGQ